MRKAGLIQRAQRGAEPRGALQAAAEAAQVGEFPQLIVDLVGELAVDELGPGQADRGSGLVIN